MFLTIRIAIKYIQANVKKLRAIFFSVFVVNVLLFVILGISNGIGKFITEKYEVLGEKYVLINTSDFSDEIFNRIKNLESAQVDAFVSSYYGTEEYGYKIVSTTDEKLYFGDGNYTKNSLSIGRYFSEYEKHNKDKKIIISYSSAKLLDNSGNALGCVLPIGNHKYEVIGVFEEKEAEAIVNDDELKVIYMYMPLSNKAYEFTQIEECIYYVTDFKSSCEEYKEKIEQVVGNNDQEVFITSSNDIKAESISIENKIKFIFAGVTLFSELSSIMILFGCINSIMLDMMPIFTFYKIVGISTKKMMQIVLFIEGLIVLLGCILAFLTELLIGLILYLVTGFEIWINMKDVLIVLIISTGIMLSVKGA